MKEGTRIRIGKTHAKKMSYENIVGYDAEIYTGAFSAARSYDVSGDMYIVKLITKPHKNTMTMWDVHKRDCIPISYQNNKVASDLLEKDY